MPCGVFTVTDIPPDRVDDVEAGFQLDKPTKIEKKQQQNGNWTVIATFPPCPAGEQQRKTTKFTNAG